MKRYRCKHVVEAMRWTDTAENREQFAAWFESHGALFVRRGSAAVLSDQYGRVEVSEGHWLLFVDGEFLTLDDEVFADTYEPDGGAR